MPDSIVQIVYECLENLSDEKDDTIVYRKLLSIGKLLKTSTIFVDLVRDLELIRIFNIIMNHTSKFFI